MKIEQIMEHIEQEDLRLEGDNIGFKIDSELGLFIAVEDSQDYQDNYLITFIELNHVDEENAYEPIDATVVVGTDLGKIQEGVEKLLKKN